MILQPLLCCLRCSSASPQGVLARRLKNYQAKLMKIKDQRVNLTNEALTGMKLIKYNGWEGNFISRIRAIRTAELKQLLSYMIFNGFSTLAWTAVPLLVSLFSFAMYSLLGNELTAAK